MDYRVKIMKNNQVLGVRDVRNPSREGWLADVVNEIMTQVRIDAAGPVGDYHIKVTEVAPGIL